MFYKLSFDMDRVDESIKDGTNTIYAETTNMDEIEYEDVKKGFFDNIILAPRSINNWPNVEFYYSSKVSNSEGNYLLNIKRWPIVHIRVMEEFNKRGIEGVQYFPVNFIDAFDMEKSKYKYNEKYDFYTFMPKETYLNRSICSEHDIFRCSKSVAAIYVSEKIRKIVEDNHWLGFTFYEQQ